MSCQLARALTAMCRSNDSTDVSRIAESRDSACERTRPRRGPERGGRAASISRSGDGRVAEIAGQERDRRATRPRRSAAIDSGSVVGPASTTGRRRMVARRRAPRSQPSSARRAAIPAAMPTRRPTPVMSAAGRREPLVGAMSTRSVLASPSRGRARSAGASIRSMMAGRRLETPPFLRGERLQHGGQRGDPMVATGQQDGPPDPVALNRTRADHQDRSRDRPARRRPMRRRAGSWSVGSRPPPSPASRWSVVHRRRARTGPTSRGGLTPGGAVLLRQPAQRWSVAACNRPASSSSAVAVFAMGQLVAATKYRATRSVDDRDDRRRPSFAAIDADDARASRRAGRGPEAWRAPAGRGVSAVLHARYRFARPSPTPSGGRSGARRLRGDRARVRIERLRGAWTTIRPRQRPSRPTASPRSTSPRSSARPRSRTSCSIRRRRRRLRRRTTPGVQPLHSAGGRAPHRGLPPARRRGRGCRRAAARGVHAAPRRRRSTGDIELVELFLSAGADPSGDRGRRSRRRAETAEAAGHPDRPRSASARALAGAAGQPRSR